LQCNNYLCCNAQIEEIDMNRTSTFLNEMFGALGSAIAVASATEQGRQPRAHDLRRLGINPEQYRGIRRI
jgi:hypothetical protein